MITSTGIKCGFADRIKTYGFMELYVAALLFIIVFRNSSEFIQDISRYPILLLGLALWIGCVVRYHVNKTIIIGIVIYSLIFLLNEYISGTSYFYSLALTICVYLPISLVFLKEKNMTRQIWYGFFFILTISLLFTLRQSTDGYYLFFSTSRNYVSVFLLVAIFACFVAAQKNNTRVPILLLLVLFCASTVAIGRGGIISTFLLLVLTGLYRVFAKKNGAGSSLRIMGAVTIIFLAVVFIIMNPNYILTTYFPRLAGENTGGSNSERMQILMWYISSINASSIQEVLFGLQPYELGGPFNRVEWNIHNSYLQLFSETGLIGILIGAILLTKSVKWMINNKQFELLFFLIAFAVRSGTDYLFPGQIGDIVVIFYCFLPWSKALTSDNNNKTNY